MKKILTRLVWVLLVVALIVTAYFYETLKPLAVDVAAVERARIEETVTEEAETQLHTERLIAADLAGTLTRIELEEGDPVSEGQVIASIEDTELQLTLGELRDQFEEIEARLAGVDVPLPKEPEIAAARKEKERAELTVEQFLKEKDIAEADLRLARSEFQRIEGLYEQSSASEQRLDTARRDLEVAEAGVGAVERRLAVTRAAVEVAALQVQVLMDSLNDTAHLRRVYEAQRRRIQKSIELLLHEARIKSPIDGVVLEKYLDSEQFVQPGTPLLKIGDMDSIEIRADILSEEIGRVQVGQKVHLVGRAVRNPGAAGTVRKIYPSGFEKISSLGVREQRVTVLIDFDNSPLNLQPGYELDVKIVVDARDDALKVPGEAVIARADGMAAFVVEEGKARLRELEIGLTGDDYYEVTSGLQEGDTVILRPPNDLEKGRRVSKAAQD